MNRRPLQGLCAAFLLTPASWQGVTGPLPGKPRGAEPLLGIEHVSDHVALSIYHDVRVDGRWILYFQNESSATGDLNGDGDTSDEVYHVHDMGAGVTRNLALAADQFPGIKALAGGRALVLAGEYDQGQTDLNGDGDTQDRVLFAADLATGTTRNSGLAAPVGVDGVLVGDRVVFPVVEIDQGGESWVAYVWDLSSPDPPFSLGHALTSDMRSHQSFVLIPVFEYWQEDDLNGDGDTLDQVLHAFDLGDPFPVPVNTGLAIGHLEALGRYSAFLVDEARQEADLNEDGDLGDLVLHVFDLETNQLLNLHLAVFVASIHLGGVEVALDTDFVLTDEAVVFHVPEYLQGGLDLNGDGDDEDFVLFLHELSTHTTRNLGFSAWAFTQGDGVVVFHANEQAQGADLNEDGDQVDFVPHVHRVATATTLDLGLQSGVLAGFSSVLPSPAALHAPWAALRIPEFGQDRNGDGDGEDGILFLVDLASGQLLDQHVSAYPSSFSPGGVLTVQISESEEALDLNGDTDQTDLVVHFLQPRSGLLVNTGPLTGSTSDGWPLGPGFEQRHPLRVGISGLRVARLNARF